MTFFICVFTTGHSAELVKVPANTDGCERPFAVLDTVCMIAPTQNQMSRESIVLSVMNHTNDHIRKLPRDIQEDLVKKCMQYRPVFEEEHKKHKLEIEALRESRQTARVAKAESFM